MNKTLETATRRWAASLSAVTLLLAAASAQSLTPVSGESTVHAPSGANQNDGGISWSVDGTLVGYCWASGQNIFARLYDGDGVPITADLLVNDTIVSGNQDQPAICVGTTNNVLVAWSDREANDGDLIGIFARVYDSTGTPLTAEFQVNEEWMASQFRPNIAPRSSGGWVVTWTGQFDGDCFFRRISPVGGLVGGDVFVNSFDSGAQVNPDVAVIPTGAIAVAFEDSSAHGGIGSGSNLWGRLFTGMGAPAGADFPLATTITAGNQKNPRIAVGPLSGDLFIVWEDDTNDGSGWGIYGRLFSAAGVPLAPEFRINTDTSGDQRRPDVSASECGDYVVTWDSAAAGGTEIRAQHFGPLLNFVGPELTISEVAQGGYLRPEVAMDPTTGEVLFVYDGPGSATDTFTRRFLPTGPPAPVSYCYGDGLGRACLCGNDDVMNPGTGGCLNSAGTGAVLTTNGLTSVCDNMLSFDLTNGVPFSQAVLTSGDNALGGGIGILGLPPSDGLRCVGGNQGRHGVRNLGASGTPATAWGAPGTGPPGGIIVHGALFIGQTRHFQVRYRDFPTAVCGFGTNTSQAIELTFTP